MSPLQDWPATAWYRQLGAQLKAHWRFKLIAGVVMTTSYFSVYFLLLYHPVFPVTEMPTTAIDRSIALSPNTLLLYITLWIYIPLGSWLVSDKRELIAYSKALCSLGFLCLAVFFLWPTSVPQPHIDVVEYPGFRILIAIDEPRNVFPCSHAAFTVFSAICIGRVLRQIGDHGVLRALNWCWCLAIIYSTMATKQHLAVDVLTGILVGVVWAGLYLRCFSWRRGQAADILSCCPDCHRPVVQ